MDHVVYIVGEENHDSKPIYMYIYISYRAVLCHLKPSNLATNSKIFYFLTPIACVNIIFSEWMGG